MSKFDLVKYKAIDRGWNKKDVQRVYKKIEELASQFEGGSIFFNEIDELAMMLDEAIDYKLEYSLCRLIIEEKILFNKLNSSSQYVLELRNF